MRWVGGESRDCFPQCLSIWLHAGTLGRMAVSGIWVYLSASAKITAWHRHCYGFRYSIWSKCLSSSPTCLEIHPLPDGAGKYARRQNTDAEKRWNADLSNPYQWWEKRGDKIHPRAPDFKLKSTSDARSIDRDKIPAWEDRELEKLDAARKNSAGPSPGGGGLSGRRFRMGLNEAHSPESYTSTTTTDFERAPREGGNKNCSGSCGDVMTLCKAGQLEDALHILNEGGIEADCNTYLCLLQECIKMNGLAEGKQVHSHILQSGFKPNIFVLNTIINMYAKCGSVVDAHRVFDKMPERDVSTWTTMMAGYAKHGRGREALEIYEQMIREGVIPNRVTFICALKACASLAVLEKGIEVHAAIIKAGVAPDIVLETALVDMYAKCGSMKTARQVFNSMAQRNVVSWSAMVAGYAQNGCGKEALETFEQMLQEGVLPNTVTFMCVLKACASLAALIKDIDIHADFSNALIAPDMNLENALVDMYAKYRSMKDARQVFNNMAKQVHAHIMQSRFKPNMLLLNTLVNLYAKCGSMVDARQVFDKMLNRTVFTWTTMMAGYAKHGCGREALEIYEQMIQEGVTPNRVTFICVLKACASLQVLEKGIQVHADILKAGIVPDIILDNTLLDMYAKCESVKDSRQVFDSMAKRDVVSWNAMIAGYAQNRCCRDALETYEQMIQEGISPNRVTFICVLKACANLAVPEKGREVHADLIKAGIVRDTILETALADMYAKCGSMKDARQVFDNMAQHNVVSCNAMIAGYAQHGCGIEALQLFEQMQQEGLKPDGVTFICLLSACSHVGLVDEGCHYFDSMSQDHGLTPTQEHFGCLVNLVGRAGLLDDAEDFIKKMPIEPHAALWGALLGSCRIHGNVEVAERAAKCLLKCNPQDATPYVLLSNIYAAAGRWDDTTKMRQIMKDRGVRQEPGCCCVQVENCVNIHPL